MFYLIAKYWVRSRLHFTDDHLSGQKWLQVVPLSLWTMMDCCLSGNYTGTFMGRAGEEVTAL